MAHMPAAPIHIEIIRRISGGKKNNLLKILGRFSYPLFSIFLRKRKYNKVACPTHVPSFNLARCFGIPHKGYGKARR